MEIFGKYRPVEPGWNGVEKELSKNFTKFAFQKAWEWNQFILKFSFVSFFRNQKHMSFCFQYVVSFAVRLFKNAGVPLLYVSTTVIYETTS